MLAGAAPTPTWRDHVRLVCGGATGGERTPVLKEDHTAWTEPFFWREISWGLGWQRVFPRGEPTPSASGTAELRRDTAFNCLAVL